MRILDWLYVEAGDHLDVFAKGIGPPIAVEPRWVAARGQEMLLIDPLFYPKNWPAPRLFQANADPRPGGVGTMVSCGAALYAAPFGIVNAVDRAAVERFAQLTQVHATTTAGGSR